MTRTFVGLTRICSVTPRYDNCGANKARASHGVQARRVVVLARLGHTSRCSIAFATDGSSYKGAPLRSHSHPTRTRHA